MLYTYVYLIVKKSFFSHILTNIVSIVKKFIVKNIKSFHYSTFREKNKILVKYSLYIYKYYTPNSSQYILYVFTKLHAPFCPLSLSFSISNIYCNTCPMMPFFLPMNKTTDSVILISQVTNEFILRWICYDNCFISITITLCVFI